MKSTIAGWFLAILLWFALSFSLGWYYTFTYYGRVGWPMPTPESLAALILYYFSVLNVDLKIQAVHWMAVFPIAGALWICALSFSHRVFDEARPAIGSLWRFALATLPLILPGPWMAYLGGQTDGGFDWDRMIQVALRGGNITPWGWLTPMYFSLGVVALVLHIYLYKKLFTFRGKRAVHHFLLSAILLFLTVSVLGAIAAIPLRLWLE